MKKATAIHLAYAIAATHFVCTAVAMAQHHQFYAAAGPRVIIPERPLPLIPGPGGSWSPSSQPYENLLVSTPQEQASSGKLDILIPLLQSQISLSVTALAHGLDV